MASTGVSSTTNISSSAPLATVDPAPSSLQQVPSISPASSTTATLSVGSTTSSSPPAPSAIRTEAAQALDAARSVAGATLPAPFSNHFTSSSSEDEDMSSDHGSPFASARGGSSLSSSAPSATLFVPSPSPSSFGPSAPVAAALAASMGMSQVSIVGSSSAAAAAAAAAYMASPTGHLLSRSMSASKLHLKKKKANVRYKDHCDNCLTDQTPQWRKGRRGETFCQDCGRSERRHDYARLKREREKAIEKTLVDLLENSVYVPRWAHSAAAQRQRSRLEALVEETSEQGLLKSETAESGAFDASGADPSECTKPEQSPSENKFVDSNSQQDGAHKADGADGEERGGDSTLGNGSEAPTNLEHGSSAVGKRKSTEEDDGNEENEEGGEQQSTTDGDADALAAVVEVGKENDLDAAVSPAAKRRRLPNQPAGQPSPVRLARRRTLPGAQTSATPTGLENNGASPSLDNDGGEPHYDSAVADNAGSTEGEAATEEMSSTAVVTAEAAPGVDAIMEE